MRTNSKAFFVVLAALAGCGDVTHNTDTGTPAGNDLDNDGNPDGWDQDEVLGPMEQYPGEIDFSTGALAVPFFEGTELTASCFHESGFVMDFLWQVVNPDSAYEERWLAILVDDRLPEGSALCALTQDGESILDIAQTDILSASDPKSVCIRQGADGVYGEPSYSECDGLRPPW